MGYRPTVGSNIEAEHFTARSSSYRQAQVPQRCSQLRRVLVVDSVKADRASAFDVFHIVVDEDSGARGHSTTCEQALEYDRIGLARLKLIRCVAPIGKDLAHLGGEHG